MGDLKERTRVVEFDINQRVLDIAEKLLAQHPAIIGLGVYVWNARQTRELVQILKRIAPGIPLIVGGPEVSHEVTEQEICGLADYVITGEADFKFAEVCRAILAGNPPQQKVIPAELPDVKQLACPYALYNEDDIAHRVIYVEASRGCPFSCEFCLSSIDTPVRQFALEPFLAELDSLLSRGVRQFKFVDRTFNLNLTTSRAILEFFRERYQPGLFVHFEMVPDRLPEQLREVIMQFPPGALQFEVGIQTFNPAVAALINRRQNYQRLEENIRFLREKTGVHIHADLIAGLPGEDLASFGEGFDRLVAMGPHEIQVGILKRLRGTPISRHTETCGMVYSADAPYEILCNKLIDFPTMQRVRRFAKYWDLVANSGNYVETTPLLWAGDGASPFWSFMAFADWAYPVLKRTDSISLATWAELLHRYLLDTGSFNAGIVEETLRRDFARAGRRELPAFLRTSHLSAGSENGARAPGDKLPKRQQRRVAAAG